MPTLRILLLTILSVVLVSSTRAQLLSDVPKDDVVKALVEMPHALRMELARSMGDSLLARGLTKLEHFQKMEGLKYVGLLKVRPDVYDNRGEIFSVTASMFGPTFVLESPVLSLNDKTYSLSGPLVPEDWRKKFKTLAEAEATGIERIEIYGDRGISCGGFLVLNGRSFVIVSIDPTHISVFEDNRVVVEKDCARCDNGANLLRNRQDVHSDYNIDPSMYERNSQKSKLLPFSSSLSGLCLIDV